MDSDNENNLEKELSYSLDLEEKYFNNKKISALNLDNSERNTQHNNSMSKNKPHQKKIRYSLNRGGRSSFFKSTSK